MITLLDGFPDNVLAVSATGQVTSEDYRDVLIPEARSRSKRHDELRYLFLLGEGFEHRAPGAVVKDAEFGFGRLGALGPTAFGTDVAWIAHGAQPFVPYVHETFRVVPTAGFDAARDWRRAEEPDA